MIACQGDLLTYSSCSSGCSGNISANERQCLRCLAHELENEEIYDDPYRNRNRFTRSFSPPLDELYEDSWGSDEEYGGTKILFSKTLNITSDEDEDAKMAVKRSNDDSKETRDFLPRKKRRLRDDLGVANNTVLEQVSSKKKVRFLISESQALVSENGKPKKSARLEKCPSGALVKLTKPPSQLLEDGCPGSRSENLPAEAVVLEIRNTIMDKVQGLLHSGSFTRILGCKTDNTIRHDRVMNSLNLIKTLGGDYYKCLYLFGHPVIPNPPPRAPLIFTEGYHSTAACKTSVAIAASGIVGGKMRAIQYTLSDLGASRHKKVNNTELGEITCEHDEKIKVTVPIPSSSRKLSANVVSLEARRRLVREKLATKVAQMSDDSQTKGRYRNNVGKKTQLCLDIQEGKLTTIVMQKPKNANEEHCGDGNGVGSPSQIRPPYRKSRLNSFESSKPTTANSRKLSKIVFPAIGTQRKPGPRMPSQFRQSSPSPRVDKPRNPIVRENGHPLKYMTLAQFLAQRKTLILKADESKMATTEKQTGMHPQGR